MGSCYVAVGGYGWVEIVARHDRASTGQRVAIVLPYHRAEHAAECLLQAPDCLVIRNGGGTIAEISVQTIVEQRCGVSRPRGQSGGCGTWNR